MVAIMGYPIIFPNTTFTGAAEIVFKNYFSIYDMITPSSFNMVIGFPYLSDANDGDNIYNKLGLAFGQSTNPYDPILDKNLYNWFVKYYQPMLPPTDPYYSNIHSTIDYAVKFYNLLINGNLPTTQPQVTVLSLYSNNNSGYYFDNYQHYIDAIIYVLCIIINNSSLVFLSNDLLVNGNEITNFNNINSIVEQLINYYGTKMIQLVVPINGSPTYIYPTPVAGYKYIPFAFNDLAVNNSEIDQQIKTLINNSGKKPNFAYAKLLGHRILQNVSIHIGDFIVDEHPDYLINFIANQLIDIEHRRGFDIMIGNTSNMYTLSSEPREISRLTIPLHFWFCKHIGNAFPLINLLYADLKVSVKLRTLNELLTYDTGAFFWVTPRIKKIKLLGSFVYLDEAERKIMAESRRTFLIECYQKYTNYISSSSLLTSNNLMTDVTNNPNIYNIKISSFKNSVKYIYWRIQSSNYKDIINWNNPEYKKNVNNQLITQESFHTCTLYVDDSKRETTKEYGYYNRCVPVTKNFYDLDRGEFIYSFALKPQILQPSGTINMSYIYDLKMSFDLKGDVVNDLNNNNLILQLDVWGCTYKFLMFASGLAGWLFIE